jgi:hypothetical protein
MRDAERRSPRRRMGLASPMRAGRSDSHSNEAAVADYIADMTAQLEAMATAAGLDLLAYFLAMARAESETAARSESATRQAAPDESLMS